uniref:MATH domain-containing protein n=1 Tax=Strigamia maritima TaxID=126957 RepID=T1IWP6_STRMM
MSFCGNSDNSVKLSTLITCPQGCKMQIHLEQIPSHLQNECPYRCIFCLFCKTPTLYINLQKHMEECKAVPRHFTRVEEPTVGEQIKSIKSCQSTGTCDCNQSKEYQKQVKLEKKYNIVEKELSVLQTQLCQKANAFPGTEESKVNYNADNNQPNFSTLEQLVKKIKKVSAFLKNLEDDVSTTKDTIYKKLNEQTTQMKKFTDYVFELLDNANKSMILTLQKQQTELMKHNTHLQHLECKNSHIGVHVWKVKKFSRLQQEVKHGHCQKITSLPFYTNEYGYKLCLEMNPNGDASGEYLSLALCIMRGGYDAILKWPVTYKATFILLDQLEGKQPFEATLHSVPEPKYVNRPTSDKNSALTFLQFFLIEDLHPHYLINDQLFVKAVVTFLNDSDVSCGSMPQVQN